MRYTALTRFLVFCFLCSSPCHAENQGAEEVSPTSATAKSLSAFHGSKKAATTQKAYAIKNTGVTKNSNVVQYDSIPSFKMYQDNDHDGNFGENEPARVDLDRDGRRGERESQIGTEFVTQHQKVTVLNNMGSGNSLSVFKAAGQTQRDSVFVKEEDKKKIIVTESAQSTKTQDAALVEKKSKKEDKRKVLVG